MKGIFKGLGLTLAAVAVIAVFAWFCLFVYWDVRIRGAIRTVDRAKPTDLAELDRAFRTLDEAGCRRLPYLIPPRDPSLKEGWRLMDLNHYFYSKAHVDPEAKRLGGFLDGFGFEAGDSLEERRRKGDGVRAWWRESGSEYHHWWNLWSTHCKNWKSIHPE